MTCVLDPFPREVNLLSYTNEDLVYAAQWLPGGTAIDFTGYTVECKAREDQNDKTSTVLGDWDALVTLNEDQDGNAGNGYITLRVPAATVDGYSWKNGFWDLVLISPGGDRMNWARGTVEIGAGMA